LLSWRLCRAGLIDKHPMPEFKHEQVPQPEVVLGLLFYVPVHIAAHYFRAEVASLARSPIEREVVGHLVRFIAKPAVDGKARPHFFPAQDLVRQYPTHNFFQEVLVGKLMEPQGCRKGSREFDDLLSSRLRSNWKIFHNNLAFLQPWDYLAGI
jgi:hypothetical protein